MGSNVSVSALGIALIFLGGVLVGWILAKVRVNSVVDLTTMPPANLDPGQLLASNAPTTKTIFRVNKSLVRTMNLKCKCGAEARFSDHPNPTAGIAPFPEGDSFACPK